MHADRWRADLQSHGRRLWLLLAVVVGAGLLGLLPLLGPGPVLLALTALGALTAVLHFQRFDLLLHLLVLSVFVESVGVGPVRVGRVLAATAVAVLLARAVFTSWRPRVTTPPAAVLPVVLFLVWAYSSGLWATNTSAWSFAMGQLALAVAYFLTFVLVVERRQQVLELLRTMVLGALFAAAVAFVQLVQGADRAEGLQGDPNIYALYQVAALPAAIMLTTATEGRQRWLGWVAVPVLLASVLATQSRGGFVTALAVLVLTVVRGDVGPWTRRHRTAVVTTVVAVTALVSVAVMTTQQRFTPERVLNDRASGRLDIWYVAFREWQDHPLVGIGGGGFKPRSVELLLTEPGVQLIKSHLLLSSGIEVHNIYLETLVEYGLIGFLLFLAVLASTAWRLQAAAGFGGDPVLRALPTMLAAFLAASFFLSVLNNKLLWILIALGVVMAGRSRTWDEAGPAAAPPGPEGPSGLPRQWVAPSVAVALLPALIATATSFVLPDTYTSSAQYVVNTSANPREREAIVRTLATLSASRVVAEDVVRGTGTPVTARELLDRTEVEQPDGSLTFTVRLAGNDRARTEALMASHVRAFTARVTALQRSSAQQNAYSLRVWGDGALTTKRLSPPVLGNAAQGLVLGLALSALVLTAWTRPPVLRRTRGDDPRTEDESVSL